MKKYLLMTAVAAGTLVSGQAWANGSSASGTIEGHVLYNNEINTTVSTDVAYTKTTALEGSVTLEGAVQVDSSAVAVNDVKQLQQGIAVTYREENELNGENGFVSAVFGQGVSEHGQDPSDGLPDGTVQNNIRAGFFAPIINTVGGANINSNGNVGVNMAAGYFNEQLNSAALATSDNKAGAARGGWAEASTTSLQSLLGVVHAASEGGVLDEDDPQQGGGSNNFRDRNTVEAMTVAGSGNIGLNAAAGALNQQINLLTIAVANDSTLAEANAGLVQAATLSYVEQQDSINSVAGPTVTASGNAGLNLAAGVGNQQLNSLTIASSEAGPAAPPGSGGGGSVFDPS